MFDVRKMEQMQQLARQQANNEVVKFYDATGAVEQQRYVRKCVCVYVCGYVYVATDDNYSNACVENGCYS